MNHHINTHTHRTPLLTLRSRSTHNGLLRCLPLPKNIHKLPLRRFINAEGLQQLLPRLVLDFGIERAWPSRVAMRDFFPQLCDLTLEL